MTEWEQLKKEYSEIPIPSDGPRQMLEAIAEARRRRNRWKHAARYGTVAAALLLVVLLPGMLYLTGGSDNRKQENASGLTGNMNADCMAESEVQDSWFDGWFTAESKNDAAPAQNNMAAPESASGSTAENGADSATEELKASFSTSAAFDKEVGEETMSAQLFSQEEREAISREILRQMEERMRQNGETYYMKSESRPDGFEQIVEEQSCYRNRDGLLVIVFEAGIIAPETQGEIEFVIPAEIILP